MVLSAARLTFRKPAMSTVALVLAVSLGPAAQPPAVAADDPALCPVEILTDLDSRTATNGTPVMARLVQSLRLTDVYNAAPGSLVLGHVTQVEQERRQIKGYLSRDRWLNSDACLGVAFDEIVGLDQKHFRIDAKLAKQKSTEPLKSGHVRENCVNKNGQLVHGKESLRTSVQVGNWVGQTALSSITLATGPVGAFVVVPVLGVAGAISPSFITNRPIKETDAHPRLKGAAIGAFSGLPFSGLVSPFIFKGESVQLLPGQQLLLSCRPTCQNSLPSSASYYTLSYGFPITREEPSGVKTPSRKSVAGKIIATSEDAAPQM